MADIVDPEQQDFAKANTNIGSYYTEKELLKASGLLLLWSALVTAEGCTRVSLVANPSAGLTADGAFPKLANLLAALGETLIGSLGLLVAVLTLLLKIRSAAIVSGFLVLQAVLGVFTVVIWVVAEPIDITRRLTAGILGFSLGLTRFILVLSVVVTLSWALAMIGGQFVMASRVGKLISGKTESPASHKLYALIGCVLPFLGGLGTFLIGVLTLAEADGSTPYLSVVLQTLTVFYPQLYITTGLVVMAWSLLGLAGVVTGSDGLMNLFNLGWFPVLLLMALNFALITGKVADGAAAVLSAYHTSKSTAITCVPGPHTPCLLPSIFSIYGGVLTSFAFVSNMFYLGPLSCSSPLLYDSQRPGLFLVPSCLHKPADRVQGDPRRRDVKRTSGFANLASTRTTHVTSGVLSHGCATRCVL